MLNGSYHTPSIYFDDPPRERIITIETDSHLKNPVVETAKDEFLSNPRRFERPIPEEQHKEGKKDEKSPRKIAKKKSSKVHSGADKPTMETAQEKL